MTRHINSCNPHKDDKLKFEISQCYKYNYYYDWGNLTQNCEHMDFEMSHFIIHPPCRLCLLSGNYGGPSLSYKEKIWNRK